jgi:dipeptidyl aminopeptidase/acylaminoacyl peptidase
MRRLLSAVPLSVALVWVSFPAETKKAPAGALDVDWIMRGNAVTGYAPNAVRWSEDSRAVYFRWKLASEARDKEFDTYVVNRDGTGLRKLTEEEAKQAPPAQGDQTKDKRFTTHAADGDVFVYDHAQGRRRQLTKTADVESAPRFTEDGKRVTFQRSNNLYVLSLADASIEQLTDIRPPGAASPGRAAGGAASFDDDDKKGTESQEFLKKEERELLEVIRERAKKREEDRAKRRKENPRKAFRLAARQSVTGLLLSGDAKYVVATIRETSEGNQTTIVPNYVTETGYTADLPARDKVGDAQARTRVAILDVATGESKWVEPEIPEAAADKGRAVLLYRPMFSDDGTRLVVMGRAADNKDCWIFALDPATAKLRTLVTLHDDAWVDGPASFTAGWLPDNERIFFVWERDGWSHLYTVRHGGGEPTQLTSGRWEVRAVELSPDKSRFLLTTSEVHAGEEHLYAMGFDGGTRTRLTGVAGGHAAKLSPDGTMLADIYSFTNKPPDLYLQEARQDAKPVRVTTSPVEEFLSRHWLDAPIVEIPARDGVNVPARLYKPPQFRRGGPAVIFVHGAGYLQNVHRQWSYYYREYMFHHLLLERGYIVLDIDYRGSAGYGRDWRTAIYRHMGGKDLDDQIDGAKWLVREHGVDAKRIGIYGGSYGGFITLMAMFTQPDVFAAGAALRPVTDWAHYNHGYTSNILNTPQKDAEAYRLSSPIYHAAGLKGALLICHGMVDVNVHFQDTVRLAQRLIELRKENWELAAYPVEDHAFVQPTSWADEYKRILKLFETNLRRGL